MKFARKKGEIHLYEGKKSIGVIFENLDKKLKLYPMADFFNTSSSFKFVKAKFK
jgi:hypothetical protein